MRIMDTERNSLQPLEGASALLVRDDSVTLPVLRKVEGGSDEFMKLVSETVPDDVACELQDMLHSGRSRYSRFGMICIILFCALSCVGVYLLWPRPRTLEKTSGEIQVTAPEGKMDARHRKLFDEAEKLFKEKKYVACASHLRPELESLLAASDRNEDWKSAGRLFWMYMEAVYAAKYDDSNVRSAKGMLARLQKLEPDAIQWPTFNVLVSGKELLKDFQYFVQSDPVRVLEINACLRNLDKALAMDQDKGGGKNGRRLKLVKAKLLTLAWLHKGAEQGFPDDSLADPGVMEREKAYSIALQYDNDADFIELRHFILQKLVDNSSFIGKIYFKGRKVRRGVVETERNALAMRLGKNYEQ